MLSDTKDRLWISRVSSHQRQVLTQYRLGDHNLAAKKERLQIVATKRTTHLCSLYDCWDGDNDILSPSLWKHILYVFMFVCFSPVSFIVEILNHYQCFSFLFFALATLYMNGHANKATWIRIWPREREGERGREGEIERERERGNLKRIDSYSMYLGCVVGLVWDQFSSLC